MSRLSRSELVETARLLAEAEHAFERVTSGFGDAAGTIGGLSSRLDQMEASLKKADQALRVLRAEAGKKKRVIVRTRRRLTKSTLPPY